MLLQIATLVASLLLLPPLLLFLHLTWAYIFSDNSYYPEVEGRNLWFGHLFLIGGTPNFFNKCCEWAAEYCPTPSKESSQDLKSPNIADRDPKDQGCFEFILPGSNKHMIALTSYSSIENLCKHRPFKLQRHKNVEVIEELAPGLFSAEGDVWKKDRRILAPAFNHSNVNQYLGHDYLTASRLTDKWLTACDGSATTIAINGDCKAFTSDTTALSSFAFDFNSLERTNCLEALDLSNVMEIVRVRSFSLVRYWRIPLLRNLFPVYRREMESIGRLNSLIVIVVRHYYH
jgi:hypothetical protein